LPYFLVYHALGKGQLVEVLPDYEGRKMEGYIVRPVLRHCPARVHSLITHTMERVQSMQMLLANLDAAI